MKNKTKVIPLNGGYYVISVGDDFHQKNLEHLSWAYHRGSKEIGRVRSYKKDTGSWRFLDLDGGVSFRDSYKLFKIIASTEKLEGCHLLNRDQVEEELNEGLKFTKTDMLALALNIHEWCNDEEHGDSDLSVYDKVNKFIRPRIEPEKECEIVMESICVVNKGNGKYCLCKGEQPKVNEQGYITIKVI